MAVVKEWVCVSHGIFDSSLPICPTCGNTEPNVKRIFTTPPGFKGDKTKAQDAALLTFTNQYGLSNFSNNQSTKHETPTAHEWAPVSDLTSRADLTGGEISGLSKQPLKPADLIAASRAMAANPVKNPHIAGREKTAVA